MAEAVRLQDLPEASEILDSDLFAILQSGATKKLTGESLRQYIEGHGGVESITLNDDYTLTFEMTDGTSITLGPIRGQAGLKGDTGFAPQVTITDKGSYYELKIVSQNESGETITQYANLPVVAGTGDMRAAVYDPNGTIASTTGGIVSYVTAETQSKVSKAGSAMTGYVSAVNGQVRNIFVSTADPTGGMDGDIWIKYEA